MYRYKKSYIKKLLNWILLVHMRFVAARVMYAIVQLFKRITGEQNIVILSIYPWIFFYNTKQSLGE